jgi:hypothetical protein
VGFQKGVRINCDSCTDAAAAPCDRSAESAAGRFDPQRIPPIQHLWPQAPDAIHLSLDEGHRVAAAYVTYYNTARLHSAIGYVTPAMRLAGRQQEIFDAPDQKLETARQRRAELRRTLPDPLYAKVS